MKKKILIGRDSLRPAVTRHGAVPLLGETTVIVTCRECGVNVKWTGLYGDWYAVCKPRG